jgi:hypothetical protein
MPHFTRTPEEQKMLDERDRRQAEHKAAMQADTARMIEEGKKVGSIKPCHVCGQDRWAGVVLSILGSKVEDTPADPMMQLLTGALGQSSKEVLWCLALTCGNCLGMHFLNLESVIKAFGETKETA